MHRPAIAALAFLISAPALAQSPGLAPEQLGQIFCLSRVASDTGPIEGLLTADLKAAIADAEAKNAEIAAQHPDEKPPLGDGIPWQAWPDYAAKCESGSAELMMDEARVAISYDFPEAPHAEYTDYLRLRLIDEPLTGQRAWRIDNVTYATDGDLRTALASAFMPGFAAIAAQPCDFGMACILGCRLMRRTTLNISTAAVAERSPSSSRARYCSLLQTEMPAFVASLSPRAGPLCFGPPLQRPQRPITSALSNGRRADLCLRKTHG